MLIGADLLSASKICMTRVMVVVKDSIITYIINQLIINLKIRLLKSEMMVSFSCS